MNKKFKKMRNKQTIGVLDKGVGNQYLNCSSEGFDIGVKNEGKYNLFKNFKAIYNNTDKWYQKWYGQLLLAIISGIIIYFLTEFWNK